MASPVLKTQSAIQAFQVHQFGWTLADGRVDPGKSTLARLNEKSTASGSASLVAPCPPHRSWQKPRDCANAVVWINQALANLRVARSVYAGAIKAVGSPYKARWIPIFTLIKRQILYS